VRALVTEDGRISSGRAIEREQRAAHGLAWLATYVESVRAARLLCRALSRPSKFGEIEDLIVRIGLGEYLAQIFGGIPMSQGEMVRPATSACPRRCGRAASPAAAETLIATGNTAANRARLADLVQPQESSGHFGEPGLDETLEAIRDEMRKFSLAEVTPHAHEWHLRTPTSRSTSIAKLAELGVFGLTLPESYSAAWASARRACASSPRSCRAAISASARSAPARRSPPS
jgi:(2S)-methylsuccinyl-CoA dehydrogenase